jgi:hypothetical protein
VKTLFKVMENIINKKDDPKVRSLPKTNKAVQSKIVEVPHALEFLNVAGFSTSGDTISVNQPDYALLNEALDSINAHVVSLGGEIKSVS